jgi:hypothetical protein
MMFCSGCGTELGSGVTFCPKCGKQADFASAGGASRSRYLIPALILVAIACCILAYLLYAQGHPHGDPMAGVDAAATDIPGAIAVSVNFEQFSGKVQRFSAEIMLAAQTQTAAQTEKRVDARLDMYDKALDEYKDSLTLWSDKIQYAELYELENAHGGPALGQMMSKYHVQRDATPSYPGKNMFYCDQTIRVIWTRAGEDVVQARAMLK